MVYKTTPIYYFIYITIITTLRQIMFTSLKDINNHYTEFRLDESVYGPIEGTILQMFNSNSVEACINYNDPIGKLDNAIGVWYEFAQNNKLKAHEYYRNSMEKKFPFAFYNLFLLLKTNDIEKDIPLELELLTRAFAECDINSIPSYFYGLLAQIKIIDFIKNNRDKNTWKEIVETLVRSVKMNDPIGLMYMSKMANCYDHDHAMIFINMAIEFGKKSKTHEIMIGQFEKVREELGQKSLVRKVIDTNDMNDANDTDDINTTDDINPKRMRLRFIYKMYYNKR